MKINLMNFFFYSNSSIHKSPNHELKQIIIITIIVIIIVIVTLILHDTHIWICGPPSFRNPYGKVMHLPQSGGTYPRIFNEKRLQYTVQLPLPLKHSIFIHLQSIFLPIIWKPLLNQ